MKAATSISERKTGHVFDEMIWPHWSSSIKRQPAADIFGG